MIELDEKRQRCKEAKSVTREDTRLLRHYGTKILSGIKDDKSETEIAAICRHSEENNNFIPKNLLLNNQEIDNSRNLRHSERIAKESSLLHNKPIAKNENNSTETGHASMPLGIYASKSVSLSDWQIRPTSKNLAASLPSRLAAKKSAFTLAEVLITLGIIGIVAALTIPTLIDKYKKHVYYVQFMKAATSIENAFNSLCNSDDGYDCEHFYNNRGWEKGFAKYFNIAIEINEDNKDEICDGYNKIPVNGHWTGNDMCEVYNRETPYNIGFVTNDGMLILFDGDWGVVHGCILDTNGANKGPNQFGRDIFIYYPNHKENDIQLWGDPKSVNDCPELEDSCGLRLLQDGKMNY